MFLCKVLFVASSVVAAAVIRCVISDCEVLVQEPWPMPHLLVPISSDVEINCTAAVGTADPPFWAIDLAADSSNIQHQFATAKGQLNTYGVYELISPIETPGPITLRLLINDTAINNQTEINCYRGAQSTTTVLRVFDPIPLMLKILDIGVSSVNLTWDLSGDDALQSFLLTISHGSSSDIKSLNESYYHFTAPEGAPPCEVYNFSVTATYVGATYTGAGCSVPSPVLSKMIPSLPSIDRLESSLNFVLNRKPGGLSLHISFEPASYCENYSVANYTLLIISSFSDELLVSMLAIHADNLTFDTGNLSENAEYSFRILVSNTVGIVSTNNTHFYTTDVQRVVATLSNSINASTLQCEFITGSDATGCMVVLTSEHSQKVQYNLTRNSTISEVLSVTLEHPPSCYTGVEAFDIESDGSVGTLPVPGQFMVYSQALCTPPLSVVPGSSGSDLTIIIGVIAAVFVVALFIFSAIIIALIIKHKAKKLSSVGVVLSQPELSTHEHVDSGFGFTEQMDSGSHKDLEQSSQIGDDSIQSVTPSDAVRGRKTTYCNNNTDNGVSEETTASVKGENIYSEIPPTASQSGGEGGAAAMDSNFRSTREPIRGGQAEEEGGGELEETEAAAAGVPPEEALYEQPV